MKKKLTLLLALAALTFSACKKVQTVKEGIAGPKGEQGLKGDNGSTIHSGTGAPGANLGALGDFYLDKNTAELYGPKAANGWPTPISLRGSAGQNGAAGPTGPQGPTGPAGQQGQTGAAGPAGAAGTQILSGSGAPANGLGSVNDFYFDTTNMGFYGPKTANGWGNALTLKATNGITTLMYVQQSFGSVTPNGTYVSDGETLYNFTATKTISINHQAYTDAYHTGLILVRLKPSGDAYVDWWRMFYLEEEELSIEAPDDRSILRTGLRLYGSQDYIPDPTGNRLKTVQFDVKVVCIPASTVVQMKNKHINITDATVVAKYLNL